MTALSHTQNDWLAPFQNWLKDAQSLDKIASNSDLFAKKVCAKEIFGSHLFLGEKTVRPAEGGTPNSFGKMGGNSWSALCAVRLNPPKKSLSSLLVRGRGFEPPRHCWHSHLKAASIPFLHPRVSRFYHTLKLKNYKKKFLRGFEC